MALFSRPLLWYAVLWAGLASLLWLPLPNWVSDTVVDGVAEFLFLTLLGVLWLAQPVNQLSADARKIRSLLGAVIGLWWMLRYFDLFPDSWTKTTAFGLVFDGTYWVIYALILQLMASPLEREEPAVKGHLWLLTLFLAGLGATVVWEPAYYRQWWPSMLVYVLADVYLLALWIWWRTHWCGGTAKHVYQWIGLMLVAWTVFDTLELLTYLPEPYGVRFPQWFEALWWWLYFPVVMMLLASHGVQWDPPRVMNDRIGTLFNLASVVMAAIALHLALPLTLDGELARLALWILLAILQLRCPRWLCARGTTHHASNNHQMGLPAQMPQEPVTRGRKYP